MMADAVALTEGLPFVAALVLALIVAGEVWGWTTRRRMMRAIEEKRREYLRLKRQHRKREHVRRELQALVTEALRG